MLGHVSAVRALLQQDITPRAALTLLISAVHLGPQQQQQQQQQQGQGQGLSSHAPAEAPPPSLPACGPVSLELTDGWYSVAAHVDEPLAQLAQGGRLKVRAFCFG